MSLFNEIESSLQMFKNTQNIKFHENPVQWVPRYPVRTGMTKLTATFRNFTNAPKTGKALHLQSTQFHVAQFILNVGYKLHKHVE